MNKLFKVLELVWLITAIGCALVAVYFLVSKDNDSALYFVYIFVIASIMYLLRRYQRKNQEKYNQQQQNLKK